MNVNAQRRMAAEILDCGENRVYFDPYFVDEIKMAITREDIRNLIKEGIIRKKYKKGISNYRKKKQHEKRKKGRSRGLGSRKGTKKARNPPKQAWIQTIRPIREKLKKMRDRKQITRSTYRDLYKKSKGGFFSNTKHLKRYIEENDLKRRGR